MEGSIDGVLLVPMKIIDTLGGDVLHGMKRSDSGYVGFGEAYYSRVESGAIKAWKRHRSMTLNLTVPHGAVRFVIFDDRVGSSSCGLFQEVELSTQHYSRLTVPPMVWTGFQGASQETSLLFNIASIPHDPAEVDRKMIDEIDYQW